MDLQIGTEVIEKNSGAKLRITGVVEVEDAEGIRHTMYGIGNLYRTLEEMEELFWAIVETGD